MCSDVGVRRVTEAERYQLNQAALPGHLLLTTSAAELAASSVSSHTVLIAQLGKVLQGCEQHAR